MSLLHISISSVLIPILLFLVFRKNHKEKAVWVIFLYCCYSLVNDCVLYLLKGEFPSLFLLCMFTICELIFAMLFFHHIFQHPLAKKAALGIAGAFLLYSSYYFYVEREFGFYGSIPATVESIIIICVSIYYLFEQINSPQSFFIYLTPQFWVVIGLLIFFSGSFFLFIYASDFSKSEMAKYWDINYTFNILKNLFFSIGFLMKNNKKGYPSLDRKYFS